MANTLNSPWMNLPVPVVGTDTGPDWATNIDASLSIIDQHNHSSGSGQQIQPNGISLTSDLPFLSNNATQLRSTRYTSQSATLGLTTDVGCVYVVGNELYYNDVSGGHQVAITSNGTVNAGAGSISGLPSGTASVTFSAGTYVFQSATSVAANLDLQSVVLRNSTASSNGLTLQAPVLGGDLTQTLPSTPAATSFMQMDSSGNMGVSIPVALGITASNIANATITQGKMAALSIGTAQLINGSVTPAKKAALGQQVSSGSGSFNAPTSFGNITNLSVTITTTGRPVWVGFNSDGAVDSRLAVTSGSLSVRLVRDGNPFGQYQLAAQNGVFSTAPSASINMVDLGASAGTHTYTAQAQYTTVSAGNAAVESVVLVVYEL